MTDKKDIKDYCKNCDVEPPAMRFKCPTCKHNPDKKETIIDGVDVSECEYWSAKDSWGRLNACSQRFTRQCECVNNPNCYFKQLKRKEQECEEYRKVNDEKNELLVLCGVTAGGERKRITHVIKELRGELQVKEQEYEVQRIKLNYYITKTTQLLDDIDNYKQTLNEIEKTIIDYPPKGIQEVTQSQIEYTQHLLNVSETKLRKILNIIDKVKDERYN